MAADVLSQFFSKLNILTTAKGVPKEYSTEVPQLVKIYKKALEYNITNVLDAFIIKGEQDMIHTEIPQKQVKLKIGISTIPEAGLGIFAAEDIPKGIIIGSYGGPLEVIDSENLKTEI